MRRPPPSLPKQQRGALLILLVIALGILAVIVFVGMLSSSDIQNQRDKITAAALAEAKVAIIGWSASRYSTSGSYTPGQLPCPEDLAQIGTANEGTAASNCTLPATGRLPWKTLKTGDIRDGYGEKLWYAISAGFRASTINSDTPANLTVDGIPGSAVAIIFAPGLALTGQTRPIPTSSSPPLVQNYLENENSLASPPNNKFVTTGTPGTFNDHLLIISHKDLFSVVEKRVAGEVMNCLTIYSATNQNNQRYPWAAKLDSSAPPNYTDATDVRFGRIPDSPFSNTQTSSGSTMDTNWPGACKITSNSGWWLNWKEMVFYGVADAYKPSNATNLPMSPACPSCLKVNPPSATADKRVVVIVAGKMLPGQSRTINADKGNAANYLEGGNESGIDMYTSGNTTPTFNDYLFYK